MSTITTQHYSMGCGASSNPIISRCHSPEATGLLQITTGPSCGLNLPTSSAASDPSDSHDGGALTPQVIGGSGSLEPHCTSGEDTGGSGQLSTQGQSMCPAAPQPEGTPLQHLTHQKSYPMGEAILSSAADSVIGCGDGLKGQNHVGLPLSNLTLRPKLNIPIGKNGSADNISAAVFTEHDSPFTSPQHQRNSLQDKENRPADQDHPVQQQLNSASTVQRESLVSDTSSPCCDQLSTHIHHPVDVQKVNTAAAVGYSLSLNYTIQQLQFQLGFIAQVTVDP